MIKDFEEAKRIYERRVSKARDVREQYIAARDRYDKANPFVKLFLRKPVEPVAEKQEEIEFPVIGQRYAIKYGDIVGPIVDATYVDGLIFSGPAYYGREFFDPTKLEVGDISSLWTMVEYTGNNQFVDLVTGKTFGLPIEADSILSMVSQNTEAQAREMKQGLLEAPLSIRCSKELSFVRGEGCGRDTEIYYTAVSGLIPELHELSDDVKAAIMEKTMPIKDKILSELDSLEKQSRDNIEAYYTRINNRQMNEFYEDAMQRSEKMREDEEEARLKAEREAKAEEQRAEKERLMELRESFLTEFEKTFGNDLGSDGRKK